MTRQQKCERAAIYLKGAEEALRMAEPLLKELDGLLRIDDLIEDCEFIREEICGD